MLSGKDYKKIINDAQLYKIVEMDSSYNVSYEIICPANKANNVYSVAKVFTATAIGICVDRGLLNVNDKLIDILQIDLPLSYDQRWKNITIHRLLKHKTGIKKGVLDIDCYNANDFRTFDYLEYVLQQPLVDEEKIVDEYTDDAFYLLGLVVEKVTSMSMADFMRKTLMIDLEFSEYSWACCPYGHTMGGTGLYIRCEDMVKLGVVYLNNGEYKGKQIISKYWVDEVIKNQYSLYDYTDGWYVKGGMLGQFLAINFKYKYVVGWMGHTTKINNRKMIGVQEID